MALWSSARADCVESTVVWLLQPAASTTGKLVKLLLPHIATAKKKRLFGRARLEAFTDGVHAIVGAWRGCVQNRPLDTRCVL